MKTLRKYISLHINQPTKLFLEDLENIISNIAEIADSISIRNKDFEFENLPDLLQINTLELTELKFHGYKNGLPILFLSIYPRNIYLEAYNDEPMVLGVMEKVKVIIRSRKRPLLKSICFLTVLASIGLVISISGLIITFLKKDLVAIDSSLLTIISLVLPATVLLQLPLSKNKISLTYSKNTTSFWKRNSDTIINTIITAIITLILGYIFVKITGFIP